jgi:hypothetical protein
VTWYFAREALAPITGWEVTAYLVLRTVCTATSDTVSAETLAFHLQTTEAEARKLLTTLTTSRLVEQVQPHEYRPLSLTQARRRKVDAVIATSPKPEGTIVGRVLPFVKKPSWREEASQRAAFEVLKEKH